MYLTKLMLNIKNPRVRKELANPYEIHRTIMSAFPSKLPNDERVLYRLENEKQIPQLLIQSVYEPNWDFLPDSYLYPISGMDKPLIKYFEIDVEVGSLWFFRLLANPTMKKKFNADTKGKRIGILKVDDQIKWLNQKATKGGFETINTTIKYFDFLRLNVEPKKNPITLLRVEYEGILRVVDPRCFAETIKNGIGSGKGFGCGLLSVARI